MEYKCLCCISNHQNEFGKTLMKHKHKFSSNKFILLLQKGVYTQEYMNDWKKFSDTSLPEKENVCSFLNVEVITDTDCMVEKGIYKDFNIKNVGEYYDFYVWSNRLLLGNAIENCQIMYLDIYELHLSSFLTGLWLE